MPVTKCTLPVLYDKSSACFAKQADGSVDPQALGRSNVAMMAGCIRQLSQLSSYAAEMFRGKQYLIPCFAKWHTEDSGDHFILCHLMPKISLHHIESCLHSGRTGVGDCKTQSQR